jgi:Domain of unknown function (DUF6531)
MKAPSSLRIAVLVVLAGSFFPTGGGIAWAHLNGGVIADRSGPAPGERFTALSSGIFTYSKTDMTLPGPMPINITRVYRSADKTKGSTFPYNPRDFGYGTRLSYDIFLHSFSEASNGTYTDAEVIMPDGGRINCRRTDGNPATDYVDAVFTCDEQPTGIWFNSTIKWNAGNPGNTGGPGWDLKRTDGTTYHFGDDAPLQSITDRFNNSITITWGGNENSGCPNPQAIPSTAINTVTSSNGRGVYFCHVMAVGPYVITEASDFAGIKQVTYAYELAGCGKTGDEQRSMLS